MDAWQVKIRDRETPGINQVTCDVGIVMVTRKTYCEPIGSTNIYGIFTRDHSSGILPLPLIWVFPKKNRGGPPKS